MYQMHVQLEKSGQLSEFFYIHDAIETHGYCGGAISLAFEAFVFPLLLEGPVGSCCCPGIPKTQEGECRKVARGEHYLQPQCQTNSEEQSRGTNTSWLKRNI